MYYSMLNYNCYKRIFSTKHVIVNCNKVYELHPSIFRRDRARKDGKTGRQMTCHTDRQTNTMHKCFLIMFESLKKASYFK